MNAGQVSEYRDIGCAVLSMSFKGLSLKELYYEEMYKFNVKLLF